MSAVCSPSFGAGRGAAIGAPSIPAYPSTHVSLSSLVSDAGVLGSRVCIAPCRFASCCAAPGMTAACVTCANFTRHITASSSSSTPQPGRLVAGACHILGVAAAVLVDALGRELQHP